MTPDEIREVGHAPMSPLQAIRAHCLDCCVYREKEVALCTAVKCPSWPFRMGTDPWRKPASQARREAARRSMAEINARRRESGGAGSSASPSEHGTAPSLATGSGVDPVWATARVHEGENADRAGNGRGENRAREGPISDEGKVIADLGEISDPTAISATSANDGGQAGDL